MKNFAFKHPFIASVLVFFAFQVAGFILGLLAGIYALSSAKTSQNPSDPNDGAAMVAFIFVQMGIFGGFILGIIFSLGSVIYFSGSRNKANKLP